MFARSFLSKVLNFSKSSMVVFVVAIIFGSLSLADEKSVTIRKNTNPMIASKNLRERQVPSSARCGQQKFGRTPTWPM